MKLFFIILIFVCIIAIPIASHYIVLKVTYEGEEYEKLSYKDKIQKNIDERNKIMTKYIEEKNLEDYITNTFLNILFRFDIEFVIIIIHGILFFLRANGQNNILSFFTNIIWGTFSKSYFSFTIIFNMVILFSIYSAETTNSVNINNIFLNFIFNTIMILVFTSISYIFLELPLKKLIKFILHGDDGEENIEDENDDENGDEEEKMKIKN